MIICLTLRYLLTQFNPGCFSHRARHKRRASHSPSAFCVFTAHKMTTTGAFVLDLPCSGNLDSFFQPFMGLLFRHLANPLKITFSEILHQKAASLCSAWYRKNIRLIIYVISRHLSIPEVQNSSKNESTHNFWGANLPFYSRAHGDLSIFEQRASLILPRILLR